MADSPPKVSFDKVLVTDFDGTTTRQDFFRMTLAEIARMPLEDGGVRTW